MTKYGKLLREKSQNFRNCSKHVLFRIEPFGVDPNFYQKIFFGSFKIVKNRGRHISLPPPSDPMGTKLLPRSCRVWSVLAPRSAMLSTALRSGQFPSPRLCGRYAVALFPSAWVLCELRCMFSQSQWAKSCRRVATAFVKILLRGENIKEKEGKNQPRSTIWLAASKRSLRGDDIFRRADFAASLRGAVIS